MSQVPFDDRLSEVLEASRRAGFFGPGPVAAHLDHAGGFAEAAVEALGREPERFCDLGPGGGVPGLVLAVLWPGATGMLVESAHRRCEALRHSVQVLGLTERIEVLEARAEIVAHDPRYRERFELVTARSFAGPAATAEIAAGLVAMGGVLVVSEPPSGDERRWSAEGLRALGFGAVELRSAANARFASIRKAGSAPSGTPRSVGRPAKRPLW